MRLGRMFQLLGVLILVLAWVPRAGAAGDAFFDQTLGHYPEELQAAQAAGKKGVLVMFETEACPYCQRMRRQVLSRPEVQAYFHRQFVILSVDILGDIPLTDPTGRDTTEKRWSRQLRVRATPTFVFFGLDGQEAARHVGEMRKSADFLKFGEYLAGGHFRQQSFPQFHPDFTATKDAP